MPFSCLKPFAAYLSCIRNSYYDFAWDNQIKRISFNVEVFVGLSFENFQNFDRLWENWKLSLESFQVLLIFTISFLHSSQVQQIQNSILTQDMISLENKARRFLAHKKAFEKCKLKSLLYFTVHCYNRYVKSFNLSFFEPSAVLHWVVTLDLISTKEGSHS